MYLDNAATTKLTKNVKDYIISILDDYGNPSSQYSLGDKARQIIEQARKNIAQFINANPNDIIFTSGGAANNSLAVKGYYERNNCNILYQPTCHKSILKCVEHIQKAYSLKVNSQGFVDMQDLKEWLNTHEDYLVVIEYANSEIGTIQNVKKIIDLCHFYNAKVYVDCTGSISQIPINIKSLDVDIIGFSGHKINALKGVGVLYKKSNIELESLVYGSQEQGLFAGTENVLGIASIGKAVENYIYSSISSNNRDYIYDYISKNIPNSYLIGADLKHRLPHNLYMCFKGIQGESLMTLLDMNNIQVSTGSACTSGDLMPSHTLVAIGMNKEDINSCVRITFSGNETKDELNYLCKKLKKNIETLRQLNK